MKHVLYQNLNQGTRFQVTRRGIDYIPSQCVHFTGRLAGDLDATDLNGYLAYQQEGS